MRADVHYAEEYEDDWFHKQLRARNKEHFCCKYYAVLDKNLNPVFKDTFDSELIKMTLSKYDDKLYNPQLIVDNFKLSRNLFRQKGKTVHLKNGFVCACGFNNLEQFKGMTNTPRFFEASCALGADEKSIVKDEKLATTSVIGFYREIPYSEILDKSDNLNILEMIARSEIAWNEDLQRLVDMDNNNLNLQISQNPIADENILYELYNKANERYNNCEEIKMKSINSEIIYSILENTNCSEKIYKDVLNEILNSNHTIEHKNNMLNAMMANPKLSHKLINDIYIGFVINIDDYPERKKICDERKICLHLAQNPNTPPYILNNIIERTKNYNEKMATQIKFEAIRNVNDICDINYLECRRENTLVGEKVLLNLEALSSYEKNAIALNKNVNKYTLKELYFRTIPSPELKFNIVNNKKCPDEILIHATRDKDIKIRMSVARNINMNTIEARANKTIIEDALLKDKNEVVNTFIGNNTCSDIYKLQRLFNEYKKLGYYRKTEYNVKTVDKINEILNKNNISFSELIEKCASYKLVDGYKKMLKIIELSSSKNRQDREKAKELQSKETLSEKIQKTIEFK